MIDILIYIDDTFLCAPNCNEMLQKLQMTRNIFTACGLTINEEKSCLILTQKMEFLGFWLDSVSYSISVGQKKCSALSRLIKPILDKPRKKIHLKLLAKIIGKMVSFFPASDEARLHYRVLERFKVKRLIETKSWNCKLQLDRHCIAELQWWKSYLTGGIIKYLHKREVTQTIFTDSSSFGFGSSWNDIQFQGLFTEKQKQLCINTKELLAIYYTLSHYGEKLHREIVHIRCDNTTAISCIRKFGSSKSVLRDTITKKIFHIVKVHEFGLQISYVKSAENKSDKCSRSFKAKSVHTEWTLHKKYFVKCIELAKVRPDIDLFASSTNTKLQKFVSWGCVQTHFMLMHSL